MEPARLSEAARGTNPTQPHSLLQRNKGSIKMQRTTQHQRRIHRKLSRQPTSLGMAPLLHQIVHFYGHAYIDIRGQEHLFRVSCISFVLIEAYGDSMSHRKA